MTQTKNKTALKYEPPPGIRKYLRFAPYYVRLRRLVARVDPFARRHAVVGRGDLVRMKRKFQFNFVKGQGLAPAHKFLDIGCGSLLGGVPVIGYLEPGKYTGLDVRPEVILMARAELKRYRLEDKQANLKVITDLRDLELGEKFDFIWSFSVLFHLYDEAVPEAFRFVARHLSPTGVYYANVACWGLPERKWLEFPIIDRSLATYREWAEAAGLSVEEIGTLADFGHRSYFLEEDGQPMLKFRLRPG